MRSESGSHDGCESSFRLRARLRYRPRRVSYPLRWQRQLHACKVLSRMVTAVSFSRFLIRGRTHGEDVGSKIVGCVFCRVTVSIRMTTFMFLTGGLMKVARRVKKSSKDWLRPTARYDDCLSPRGVDNDCQD